MQILLEAKNIVVDFKGKEVVKNISLSIFRGKIYSIIGPNGCGKTTLLRMLSRNLKPSSGSVLLQGKNIFHQPSKHVAKTMAVLTQSHSKMMDVTVRQLVSYGRFAHKHFLQGSSRKDIQVIDDCIRKTNLKHLEDQKLNTLSGGERQRAWIAMAIAQCPEILLLDEPTTFLDIAHQLEILELIRRLNREENMTILMVLHDINHAARYSDELFVMKDGELIDHGETWNIVTADMLQKVFQVEAIVTEDKIANKPIFYAKNIVS